MFPFSRISQAAPTATHGVPRVVCRREDAMFQSDRRVASMANLSAWPISAVGGALAIAKDHTEWEAPWRRQLVGSGCILGLALQGLALPVGL